MNDYLFGFLFFGLAPGIAVFVIKIIFDTCEHWRWRWTVSKINYEKFKP